MLTYFTPDGLSDLLHRCGPIGQRAELPNDAHHPDAALLLVRAAALRGHPEQVDIQQAQRLSDVLLGGLRLESANDLVALAGEISARNRALRDQIVFAVGNDHVNSQFVFSPYAAVPSLVDGLAQAIRKPDMDTDPAVGAAIAGYYALHAHPFLDGNGRWSRLVAVRVGAASGSPLLAMLAATFHSTCKGALVRDVWPATRSFGLRRFLTLSLEYERLLLSQMGGKRLFEQAQQISFHLRKAMRTRINGNRVLKELYSTGHLSLSELRLVGGLSNRAAAGIVKRIVDESDGQATEEGGGLGISPMLGGVNNAANFARNQLFEPGNHNAI